MTNLYDRLSGSGFVRQVFHHCSGASVMRRRVADPPLQIAAAVLIAAMAFEAKAAAESNSHLRVSTNTSGVFIKAIENLFTLLAPAKPDDYTADVEVAAINGWELLKPKSFALQSMQKDKQK